MKNKKKEMIEATFFKKLCKAYFVLTLIGIAGQIYYLYRQMTFKIRCENIAECAESLIKIGDIDSGSKFFIGFIVGLIVCWGILMFNLLRGKGK